MAAIAILQKVEATFSENNSKMGDISAEFDVREPPSPVTPDMIKLILDKKIKHNKTHFLIEFVRPQEFGLQAWVSRDFLEPSRDLILEFNRRQRLERSTRTAQVPGMLGTMSAQRDSPAPCDSHDGKMEVPRGFRIAEDGTLRRKRGRPPKNFNSGSSYYPMTPTRHGHGYHSTTTSSQHLPQKLVPSSSSGHISQGEFVRRGRGRPRGSKNKNSTIRTQYGSTGHILRHQYEDDFVTYGPLVGDDAKIGHSHIKFNHKKLRDDEMSDLSADEDYHPKSEKEALAKHQKQPSKHQISTKELKQAVPKTEAANPQSDSFLGKRARNSPSKKNPKDTKAESSPQPTVPDQLKLSLTDSSAEPEIKPVLALKTKNQVSQIETESLANEKSAQESTVDERLAIKFDKPGFQARSKKNLPTNSSSSIEGADIRTPMFPTKTLNIKKEDELKSDKDLQSKQVAQMLKNQVLSFSSSIEPRNPIPIKKNLAETKLPLPEIKKSRQVLRSSTPKHAKTRRSTSSSRKRDESSSPDYKPSARSARTKPLPQFTQSSSHRDRERERTRDRDLAIIGVVSHIICDGEELYQLWMENKSRKKGFEARELVLISEGEMKRMFGESESSKYLLKYWKSTRLRPSLSRGRNYSDREHSIRNR